MVSDDSPGAVTLYSPTDAAVALQNAGPAVIIVEDIDESWCDMFCAQFPQWFDRRFFARHILRAAVLWERYAPLSSAKHTRT